MPLTTGPERSSEARGDCCGPGGAVSALCLGRSRGHRACLPRCPLQGPAPRPQGTGDTFWKPQKHRSTRRTFQPPKANKRRGPKGTAGAGERQHAAGRGLGLATAGRLWAPTALLEGGRESWIVTPRCWTRDGEGRREWDWPAPDIWEAEATCRLTTGPVFARSGPRPQEASPGQGGKGSSREQSQCLETTAGRGPRPACAQTRPPTSRRGVQQRETGTRPRMSREEAAGAPHGRKLRAAESADTHREDPSDPD